jgi:hypothetical protein
VVSTLVIMSTSVSLRGKIMSIEAMKQALEAIEAAIEAGDWKVDGACDPDMAIHSLRQAISEAKWEPKIFRQYSPSGDLISIKIQRAKDGELEVIHPCVDETAKNATTEWVGFTHEELAWLNEALNLGGRLAVIEAIEAKLKEKNT